jgi:hypothetical protein
MAVPTAPYWDGVALPGAGGIRVPTEVYGTKPGGNFGGVLALSRETDFDVAAVNTARGVANSVPLLPAECMSSLLTFNNSSANNINFTLPAVFPGQRYVLENRCGNSITFLVTGKTGVTLANNNTQDVVCSTLAADIIAVAAAKTGA